MRRTIFFGGLFSLQLLTVSLDAQTRPPERDEKVNLYDEQGKKHGTWVTSTGPQKGEPAFSEFGRFEHGKKLGPWYKITREGELIAIEHFKNDLLDGEVKYYDRGKLYCSGHYHGLNPVQEFDTIVVIHPETYLESYRVVASDKGTVKHGTWKYFDPATGHTLREEEYQVDELVFRKDFGPAPADSAFIKKREMSLPHKKGKKAAAPPGKAVSYTKY